MVKRENLIDDLIQKRDQWREQIAKVSFVIKGHELPLEKNRMGNYKWYLYPAKTDAPTRTLLMWVQEIPAGGRSGKQRTQGGRMHYVMEGQGYTVIDGIKHEWEQGDIVLIPIKPSGGTEHQHFNADPHHPVQLLVAEPNWYAIFGVDMAGGFEVTEDQPDYQR